MDEQSLIFFLSLYILMSYMPTILTTDVARVFQILHVHLQPLQLISIQFTGYNLLVFHLHSQRYTLAPL